MYKESHIMMNDLKGPVTIFSKGVKSFKGKFNTEEYVVVLDGKDKYHVCRCDDIYTQYVKGDTLKIK